jgi:hypothetical protein
MGPSPSLFQCPACKGMVAASAAACPHCGYRPPSLTKQSPSLNMAAVVITVGGALVAVGSFLPWATASAGFLSVSRSGIDGGDGIFTLLLGGLIAVIGLAWPRHPFGRARWPMLLLGVLAIGLAVFEEWTIQGSMSQNTSAFVVGNIGVGIYAIAVGGLMAVLGAGFGD